jgi:hypothetical protein
MPAMDGSTNLLRGLFSTFYFLLSTLFFGIYAISLFRPVKGILISLPDVSANYDGGVSRRAGVYCSSDG